MDDTMCTRDDTEMHWTFEEINREWFGGAYLHWEPNDVERAFAVAEEIRGRDWVLGPEFDLGTIPFPGVGRRGGFSQFLRVYWFGKRMQAIAGLPGADSLRARILANDPAAESELTAIYLLRSRQLQTDAEIEPEVTVGEGKRRPDFRIRNTGGVWMYVEVTQLNRSAASTRMQQLLQRVADQVISISQPFLLEIVFWREPTQTEEDEVVLPAQIISQAADGERRDIGDFASVLVKSGDPAVVVPSILQNDGRTRMSLSRSIVGPDQPNRQIVLRVPFADQRAEDILTAEAKQLPKGECGVVMVDVTAQPTAFESWPELVPHRFAPQQHTRVAGIILFSFAIYPTSDGLAWVPNVKLISNPHARIPLPGWISEMVAEIRADCRRLIGHPD